MSLPAADLPLYNHPLPDIEQWLRNLGCEQDRVNLNYWRVERATWKAELCLETEEITVRYFHAASGRGDIIRSFKYSLSRRDVEEAVFSGP